MSMKGGKSASLSHRLAHRISDPRSYSQVGLTAAQSFSLSQHQNLTMTTTDATYNIILNLEDLIIFPLHTSHHIPSHPHHDPTHVPHAPPNTSPSHRYIPRLAARPTLPRKLNRSRGHSLELTRHHQKHRRKSLFLSRGLREIRQLFLLGICKNRSSSNE